MDEKIYLPPAQGGRWAISRQISGRWVHLIEDAPLEHESDAEVVLRALGALVVTPELLDRYFPHCGSRGRCPTLALLELCNALDPTNPLLKKSEEGQVGV